MFKPVSSKVSFPQIEERVLGFWREHEVFRRTLEKPAPKGLFVLYEGPPTANGSPGIHHVLARVFKDIIPRYKTMQGFCAPRKGGWDTHGLPVELEVEKELGITAKPQIEAYGIERFNARCKESVFRYVKEWEDMTERIGFWIDMKNAYVTCDNGYIETCWWIIKQLWDRGLIYQGFKVTPHCPRCVTTLSSHEVALGYQENTPDPSVFVKFRLKGWVAEKRPRQVLENLTKYGEPIYFLAWTTTPWTLPGNTALAVDAQADYSLVEVASRRGKEKLVLASALADKVISEPHRVLTQFKGMDLVALTYEKLYDPSTYGIEVKQFRRQDQSRAGEISVLEPVRDFEPRIVHENFLSLEEGTGIVHIAPAFGAEDYEAGQFQELAFLQSVDLQGKFLGTYPFTGKFVKEADEDIMQDLRERGLLYKRETIHHTYPFCWRCDTPLLYYAKPSWYIRTTALKEALIEGNSRINWYPDYIKEGRFGEWLRNNVDWAISRERYWGTPIPIWRCERDPSHVECIGSVERLRALAKRPLEDLGPVDLHRPWVDRVVLRCPTCGSDMRRIPELMDVWFDSGAMPLAQFHYPFENASATKDGRFPADYICEAVDQTRGWFYSLHAISTLLMGEPCYRNVICLGLILDEKGEKMSKSKGNVVQPWSVINVHGADALRWYLYTAAPPGNSRRFSATLVEDVVRRFLLTLWNTYNFFVTYANLDGFDPTKAPEPRPVAELDRWVLSELQGLVQEVTDLLERYNPTDAGRRVEEFVEMLSTWYVRRSRRRFWRAEDDEDKLQAYQALYTCLVTLSRLLAPFMPFMAEEMYQNLVRSVDSEAPESVHMASWPQPDPALQDEELSRATQVAMRAVSLGRAARSKARLKVRQPLHAALVKTRTRDEEKLLQRMAEQVKEELNVKELRLLADESQVVEHEVRPDLAALGKKYGARLQQVRQALAAEDAQKVAQQVLAGRPVEVGGFTLLPEEVQVSQADRPGYAVASEGGYTVAVSTQVTPELAQEGLARELVHRVQNLRRAAGFDISDRIETFYQGPGEVRQVVERFADYIKGETLSLALTEGPAPEGAHSEKQRLDGMEVALGVRRAPRA